MNPLLSTLVECDSWTQHEGFETLASEVIAKAVAATKITYTKKMSIVPSDPMFTTRPSFLADGASIAGQGGALPPRRRLDPWLPRT